jgi:hypothetical protein
MKYITRYNSEENRWEVGYWIGRVFYIKSTYKNVA